MSYWNNYYVLPQQQTSIFALLTLCDNTKPFYAMLKKLFLTFLITVSLFPVSAREKTVTNTFSESESAFANPMKGFRGRRTPYVTLDKVYIKWNEIENNASDTAEKIAEYSDRNFNPLYERGIKVIPRVYLCWPHSEQNEDSTRVVMESFGRKRYVDAFWPEDMTVGDYTSDQFKERVVKLIEKMARVWDNDKRVAYVEMGLVGFWGEHHSPAPTEQVQKILAEAFQKNFRNKLVMIRNYTEFEDYDFGFYWDSFAHIDQEDHMQAIIDKDVWRDNVIGGEVAYDWGNYRIQPGASPSVSLSEPEHLEYILDCIRKTHANHLGWISNYTVGDPAVEKGAAEFQKTIGYRFVITEASYNPVLKGRNPELDITLKVTNVGSSPLYQDFPMKISLLDTSNHKVVWSAFTDVLKTSQWLPGDDWDQDEDVYRIAPSSNEVRISLEVPDDLAKGEYYLAVTLADPSEPQFPVRFAQDNYFKGGYTVLGRIGVGKAPVSAAPDGAVFDDIAKERLPIYADETRYPYTFSYTGNPLVRHHGAGDPDAHVWDGVVYVYCSQDNQRRLGDDGNYDAMDGYHVFSTKDMKTWTDHGEILHSRDVPWGGEGYMWAPGAACKDGKYYLYYPHKDVEGKWRVGVAVSDSPTGPFVHMDKPIDGLYGIDPMVFIDDDGQAYIYCNPGVVAKLKPNMVELAEPARKVIYGTQEQMKADDYRFCEGAYMHKYNGKYYFSYTSLHNSKYQSHYSVGDSPYGPFRLAGPMAERPEGAQDHHSVIEFNGKWYYFYHAGGREFYPLGWTGERRILCFDEMHYNEDGTIRLVRH